MVGEVELSLRSPQAYGLARDAVAAMESQKVWPTPLNFELWLHYVGNPDGPLGRAIHELVSAGAAITETVSERLAAEYLPKARLNEEIRDAGDKLSQQLESISAAIQVAQLSNDAYGKTLAGASQELAATPEPGDLAKLVQGLTSATCKVQQENSSLEKRLNASTDEVSRLREHLEQVRREAMTDALTTLANRKALDEGLLAACTHADIAGQPLTLAIVDIDHFKRFNDTWGHQTGDQVIRYVASVMARVGGAPRLAARFGGEEFALIFPGEDAGTVRRELESVRQEIGSRSLKRRSTNEDLGAVTVSIGLAQYNLQEGSVSILERADAALYASKRGGRNQVSIAANVQSQAA